MKHFQQRFPAYSWLRFCRCESRSCHDWTPLVDAGTAHLSALKNKPITGCLKSCWLLLPLFLEVTTEDFGWWCRITDSGVNLGVYLGRRAEVGLFAVVMVSAQFKIETNKKSLTKPPATTALVPLLWLYAEHLAAFLLLQCAITPVASCNSSEHISSGLQCRSYQSVRAGVVSPCSAGESSAAVLTHLLGAGRRHRELTAR